MPRPIKTRTGRVSDVDRAASDLAQLILIAAASEAACGYADARGMRAWGATAYDSADARTMRAWEAVELSSGIIYRQSRILAGKSRGG